MAALQQDIDNPAAKNGDFHFIRTRLINTFTEAMKYPLITVCAGAGYGKTTAVGDFVKMCQANTVWVQLSERDNVGARFWENFSHSMSQINAEFSSSIKKLGFPDTVEKLKQYITFQNKYADKKRRIIVFDDCHCIENPAVIRFVKEAIGNLPPVTNIFIISRSTPRLNIAGLISSDQIYEANEDILRFTESELAQYFRSQGITLKPDTMRSIWQDTEGWAFALNYIARSYKKAPSYEGYLRNAMKSNIFNFMETEIWDAISARLKNFLVRLSLIDHLSVELISQLGGTDEDIVTELEKQNDYVRRDSYINAYLIHPLFLEFLAAKQDILSPELKRETYSIAGVWCNKNGFKIDALSYFEKVEDYNAIVGMFIGSPAEIPFDISCYAAKILDNAPQSAFDNVIYLASTHLRTIMCQGLWEESDKKAAYYEEIFLKLPDDNPFKISTLRSIYYCWSLIRMAIGVTSHVYDFDIYHEKNSRFFTKPVDPGVLITRGPAPWICAVGSSKKGKIQEFIDAMQRSVKHLEKCFINRHTGEADLALGEFKFYQGEIQSAETSITQCIISSRAVKQMEVVHRGLFYEIRIAVLQGNYNKMQQTLNEMKANLDLHYYSNRFFDYDLTLCWYYCTLGIADKVPDWLKENFSHYAYSGFLENYANQMKARYCYLTRNYHPLLSYIQDMKKRESFLFGRIEMLAIEACVFYKMKEKDKAYKSLEEAYENACGNNIIMPFIELGKDMRTLTIFALKKKGKIPKEWLNEINRKSASYAKRLTHVISKYKQVNQIVENIVITPRERDILTDLSHGLSRSQIAASRNLSINTVKMLVNNVYMKLGAENLSTAIRIATEQKII